MPAALRLPTTNIHAQGDYTVTVSVGSNATPLQLILDTGSSTLALHTTVYQPSDDKHLSTTVLAQEVIYGLGGWAGPVVKTSMQLHGDICLTVPENYVAIAAEAQLAFTNADGLLGLAYNRLNQAVDITDYLQQQQPAATSSFPWPYTKATAPDLKQIQSELSGYPKQRLTPWFSNIEQHGLTANCFAFYCQRSSVHFAAAQSTALPDDPLNNGWFILGGGTEQTDLYHGEFQTISVKHDVYYNVQLTAIQVATLPAISCKPSESEDLANGFIDTGASAVLLPADVYQGLLHDICQFNPSLDKVIQHLPVFNGTEQGIAADLVQLTQWPELHFYFSSENGNICKLTCPPHDYWQQNAPAFGLCSFKIIPQLAHFANLFILGLPLLCNNYMVFDRAWHQTGVIR